MLGQEQATISLPNHRQGGQQHANRQMMASAANSRQRSIENGNRKAL